MSLDVLARAQVAQGAQVTLAVTYYDGSDLSLVEGMRSAGVNTVSIGPSHGAMDRHPLLDRTVRDLVRESQVVHIHGLWQEIQHRAARSAMDAGVPYVVKTCGMLSPWSLSQSRLKKQIYLHLRLKRTLRGAAALHFTAEGEREEAGELATLAPAILEPNGVDLAQYRRRVPGEPFRQERRIAPNQPLVLFLGRLHPKKGIDLLIGALKRVAEVIPDVTLVIAGPDENGYRAVLERQIRSAGLLNQVMFTGRLDRAGVLAALSAADLFVLPSRSENFAVAVVESLAAGTPVIVSDRVGVHEDVQRGKVGAVVPLDLDALARELTRWLSDSELRAGAAARAPRFAQEHFDANAVAARWLEHYRTLSTIGEREPKAAPREHAQP
jgi:glycosyltransferase involved in cell wall biosynthesis